MDKPRVGVIHENEGTSLFTEETENKTEVLQESSEKSIVFSYESNSTIANDRLSSQIPINHLSNQPTWPHHVHYQ